MWTRFTKLCLLSDVLIDPVYVVRDPAEHAVFPGTSTPVTEIGLAYQDVLVSSLVGQRAS